MEKMKVKWILWCPQHKATNQQIAELESLFAVDVVKIWTLQEDDEGLFNRVANITKKTDIESLAWDFVHLIKYYDTVILPIGSPEFMYRVGVIISHFLPKISVLIAHSDRNVITNNDGTKTVRFEHAGFREVNLLLNTEHSIC